MGSEEGQFINTHDAEKLQDYFDSHFPNPEEEFGWKLMVFTEKLMDSEGILERSAGYIFALFIAIPYFALESWFEKIKKNRQKRRAGK